MNWYGSDSISNLSVDNPWIRRSFLIMGFRSDDDDYSGCDDNDEDGWCDDLDEGDYTGMNEFWFSDSDGDIGDITLKASFRVVLSYLT